MKKIALQYGDAQIEINVPDSAQVLSAGQVRPNAAVTARSVPAVVNARIVIA